MGYRNGVIVLAFPLVASGVCDGEPMSGQSRRGAIRAGQIFVGCLPSKMPGTGWAPGERSHSSQEV